MIGQFLDLLGGDDWSLIPEVGCTCLFLLGSGLNFLGAGSVRGSARSP